MGLHKVNGNGTAGQTHDQHQDHFIQEGGIVASCNPGNQKGHGDHAGVPNPRAQQHAKQNGREGHGNKISIDIQVTKHGSSHAQNGHDHGNQQLAGIVEQIPVQKPQGHKIADHGDQHQQRGSLIAGKIIRVVLQQTECLQHGQLTARNPIPGPDDILSLKVHDGLHGIHGRAAGDFRGFLLDDHVGLQAASKHCGNNILGQGDVDPETDNLENGLNGLAQLSLPDGGVQAVLHSGGDRRGHVFEGIGGSPQQGADLISIQREGSHQPLGVLDFRIREDGLLFSVLILKRLGILNHRAQLAENLVQGSENLLLDPFLKPIGRFDRRGCRLALFFRSDLIDDVLGRVDRLPRDGSHGKIILLWSADQAIKTEEDEVRAGKDQSVFCMKGPEPETRFLKERKLIRFFLLGQG